MGIRVAPSVINRMKNAAYWRRVTFNSLGIDAIETEVKRLENEYNGGAEFKPITINRTSESKPQKRGRPPAVTKK